MRTGPLSALRAFLRSSAAGGIVLMAAALAALVAANSPWSAEYAALVRAPLWPFDVELWVNDGLMALFFLLVGLEIKRELVDGELTRPADRRLPIVVALAGMVVPALVYVAVVGGDRTLLRGWAIPAATDIAFAIGVMALLGRRVPSALKLFLTTVAIVDDMGAVVIIAVAYGHGIVWPALAGAAGTLALLWALNRRGVRHLAPYLLLGLLLWVLTLISGVHPTIAGVLLAFTIPFVRSPGAPDDAASPLHRLEHALSPWVAFAIVPVFGFVNAGVALDLGTLTAPLVLAIALGLFVGKQAGILGAIALAHRTGYAPRPHGASWLQLYGVALLAGIGFTMSLFIGGLAFADPRLLAEVKLGVLVGSLSSGVAGYLVLRYASR